METFYMKAHTFVNRYPERMPNLPWYCERDSNQCAWGSLSLQNFTLTPSLRFLLNRRQSEGLKCGKERLMSLLKGRLP